MTVHRHVCLRAFAVGLSSTLFLLGQANAAFTVYKGDQAGFDAAAGGTKVTEDFAGASDGGTGHAVANRRLKDSIFNFGDIEEGMQVQSSTSFADNSLASTLQVSTERVGTSNDTDALAVTFTGSNVLAAGVTIDAENDANSVEIKVLDTAGTEITSDTQTGDGFFGIINDAPIGMIVINEPAESAGNIERFSAVTFYTTGDQVVTSTADEAAGTNCENGGNVVKAGKDLDGDGELAEAEVEGMEFICDEAADGAGTSDDDCRWMGSSGNGLLLALLLALLGGRALLVRRRERTLIA